MNKQGGNTMRGTESECMEVHSRHPSPGSGLHSRYKPLLMQLEGKKQALLLNFLLYTNSHVISLNPSPSPSNQSNSLTACLPSLKTPYGAMPEGRVSNMKASSFP